MSHLPCNQIWHPPSIKKTTQHLSMATNLSLAPVSFLLQSYFWGSWGSTLDSPSTVLSPSPPILWGGIGWVTSPGWPRWQGPGSGRGRVWTWLFQIPPPPRWAEGDHTPPTLCLWAPLLFRQVVAIVWKLMPFSILLLHFLLGPRHLSSQSSMHKTAYMPSNPCSSLPPPLSPISPVPLLADCHSACPLSPALLTVIIWKHVKSTGVVAAVAAV